MRWPSEFGNVAQLSPMLKRSLPVPVVDFEPYGYDERQFCSPGFELPVGRLTRSPNGQYPEYPSPKGEPRLGKRGLYGSVGGVPPGDFEQALLWVLSYCDGEHDLLSIAERSRLGFARIPQAASAREAAGLVRPIDQVRRGELQ